MRRTESRVPRESREASSTSPFSTAVKTFSMRFGSRRIQRPSHQKTRSNTTATPMMDTIRIGHMMGPPLRKLSIRKFVHPAFCGVVAVEGAAAEGEGEAALKVAETTGLGIVPGTAGDVPGAPTAGEAAIPGAAGDATPGAPGEVTTAGEVATPDGG